METVLKLLPFVLPPLLGAVIGYVTNALAIRMLFRPLTERRFLGMRVPLTPGVIPRQRHQLAHSIARMVSTKLLTEEVLIARLHDPEFTRVLETSVGRFTADILDGVPGAEGAEGSDVFDGGYPRCRCRNSAGRSRVVFSDLRVFSMLCIDSRRRWPTVRLPCR